MTEEWEITPLFRLIEHKPNVWEGFVNFDSGNNGNQKHRQWIATPFSTMGLSTIAHPSPLSPMVIDNGCHCDN